ncbi:MAG: acyl-CoA dehydrogenase family protein [Myxococcales bacterium]|nr:acyl-CoA dehydrogenase family protein [Myxococcales bacterium]
MGNFFRDNEDLRFYLERGVDWERLVSLTERALGLDEGFEDVSAAIDFYQEVLELVGTVAADEIAPKAAAIDRAHPRLEAGEVVHPEPLASVLAQLDALELHGLTVPRELGGLNAPLLVFHMQSELLARADVSVCAHHGFHAGIAMAALAYSIDEGTTTFDEEGRIVDTRFREVVDTIVAGQAWGSMDITEPDAGSDMAALRCRGTLDADGNWTVTGQKIFITSGHGRWHFVVARTEDEPGLRGLSLFLVEAFDVDADGTVRRTHTTLDGVEDKLGHHASATVSISFENAPAQLVGQRGRGFQQMLVLMNGARVGVGFEALGLCEAAHRAAADYASERVSMGKTLDQHEMIACMLDEMRTDIQAIRCLAMSAGYRDEVAKKIDIRLRAMPPADPDERAALERESAHHQRRARHLTPLLKYLAAEKAVQMAQRCLQIHGGSGYIVESGVEKLLRDAMVMPIYEGTSQIQALMAMKDNLMAAVNHPRTFVRTAAAARWRATMASDPLARRVAKLQTLQHQAIRFLLSRLAGSKLRELRGQPMADWSRAIRQFDPKRDFAPALLHAERLCIVLTDVAVAEELLQQCAEHEDRRELLVRWLERAEPRSRGALDQILTQGQRLLDALAQTAAPDVMAAK